MVNNFPVKNISRTKFAFTTFTQISAVLFLAPVLLGLIGIVLPAAGYLPALGRFDFSWAPFQEFLNTPGLQKSIWLSLKTGLLATLTSLVGCFMLLVTFSENKHTSKIRWALAPLVAIPHSTIAIGLLFLLAPSGWLIRLLSPWLTGFHQPPIWSFVPDEFGLTLVLGLIAKEIPFLLMISLSIAGNLPLKKMINIGASLRYGKLATWILIILPLIYSRIRLPTYAVLVYSISVVDMSLLLAPSLPPPLAVIVINGFNNGDMSNWLPASVGATLQIGLALLAVAIWMIGEMTIALILGYWRRGGWRLRSADRLISFALVIFLIPVTLGLLGLLATSIWSVSKSWFFPSALPSEFSFIHWQEATNIFSLVANSLYLASASTFLSIVIVLMWVYRLKDSNKYLKAIHIAIYLPLFVPQISFLFGIQIGFSWLNLDGSWLTLIYSHMIFVIPYIWLILEPAVRKMDERYDRVASSLGLIPFYRFFKLHIPLLSFPLATAIFVGFAVSISLYLPTIFIGGGRISTITIEAVSLASIGSRSLAGVAAMLQLILPMLCFFTAYLFLNLRFKNFSEMRGGGIL